jgi:hypothetical protein
MTVTDCNCLHNDAPDLACVCDDPMRGDTLRDLAELAAYRDIDTAIVAYRELSAKLGGAR